MKEAWLGRRDEVLRRVSGGIRDLTVAKIIAEAMVRGQGLAGLMVAAIIYVGGILDRKSDKWKDFVNHESDLVFQAYLFRWAINDGEDAWKRYGLDERQYLKACEVYRRYWDLADGLLEEFPPDDFDERKLEEAIIEAMADHLWARSMDGEFRFFRNAEWDCRDALNTTVCPEVATLVLGLPYDFEAPKLGDVEVVRFITPVDLDWVKAHYPDVIKKEPMCRPHNGEPYVYYPTLDAVIGTIETTVFGQVVESDRMAQIPSSEEEAQKVFALWLTNVTRGAECELSDPKIRKVIEWNLRQFEATKGANSKDLGKYAFVLDRIALLQWFLKQAAGATSFRELDLKTIKLPNIEGHMAKVRREAEEKLKAARKEFLAAISSTKTTIMEGAVVEKYLGAQEDHPDLRETVVAASASGFTIGERLRAQLGG